MVKIQGHTVGNDGVVYNPDTASFGYVGGLDSRNTEERRQEYLDAYKPTTDGTGVVNPKGVPVKAGPGSPRQGGNPGSGPGAETVRTRPASAGSQLKVSVPGPLKPALNPEVTQVMAGGDWWMPNPWFSDAQEWTTRYGEGELAETLFLVTTAGADLAYNNWRFSQWATPKVDKFLSNTEKSVGSGVQRIVVDMQERVNAPLPKQEPVDWGR